MIRIVNRADRTDLPKKSRHWALDFYVGTLKFAEITYQKRGSKISYLVNSIPEGPHDIASILTTTSTHSTCSEAMKTVWAQINRGPSPLGVHHD